jgi:hypothetical protein
MQAGSSDGDRRVESALLTFWSGVCSRNMFRFLEQIGIMVDGPINGAVSDCLFMLGLKRDQPGSSSLVLRQLLGPQKYCSCGNKFEMVFSHGSCTIERMVLSLTTRPGRAD